MKITKRQLRRIIREERGNYPMSQYSDIEPGEDTPKRRPELQAILDAANAAHETVPYRVLKNFFWELNSSYASKRKIMERKSVKITRRQLRRIIQEAIEPAQDIQDVRKKMGLPPAETISDDEIAKAVAGGERPITWDIIEELMRRIDALELMMMKMNK